MNPVEQALRRVGGAISAEEIEEATALLRKSAAANGNLEKLWASELCPAEDARFVRARQENRSMTLDLRGARLIHESEYLMLKERIPPCGCSWFTDTPDPGCETCIRIVTEAGSVSLRNVSRFSGGIRPVLLIGNAAEAGLCPGDTFQIGVWEFRLLTGHLAIACKCIRKCHFSMGWDDNQYSHSQAAAELESWYARLVCANEAKRTKRGTRQMV